MKIRALVFALAMLLGSIVTAQGQSQCSCSVKGSTCVKAGGYICGYNTKKTIPVVQECQFLPKGPKRPNPICQAIFMVPLPHAGTINNDTTNTCETVASEDECGRQQYKVRVATRCVLNAQRDGCDMGPSDQPYRCSTTDSRENTGVDGARVDSRACAACRDSGKCEAAKCKVTTEVAANQCKPGSTVEESCVWSNAPTPAPVASAAPEVPVFTPPASASAEAPFTPPASAFAVAPVFTPPASASAVAPVFTPLASASAVAY